MKNNLKQCSFLKRSRVILWGLLAASLQMWSAQAAVILDVDVGNPSLAGNTAGQTFDLYIVNNGDTLQAQGLTFRLEILGGSGLSISSLDLVTGTPWAGQLGSVTIVNSLPQLWEVNVLSDFFSNKYAELGASSSTKLGTITFDTAGLGTGPWTLVFDGTKYNPLGNPGNEIFPTFTGGQITLTPVPEPVHVALPIFGGLAVVIGGVRRWRHRNGRAG